MDGWIPAAALFFWQLAAASALRLWRASEWRAASWAALVTLVGALGCSAVLAANTWSPTVAFWWWTMSMMVAAVCAVAATAYIETLRESLGLLLVGLVAASAVATWCCA